MQRICGGIVSAAVAGLLVTASAAHAQSRAPRDVAAPPAPQLQGGATAASLDEAARLLFESARAAFDSGDYETALERFKQAYAASPRAALLFNIAMSADRLRRDDEALTEFEQYLAAAPDVDNRTQIEARIRSLRAAIAAREHAQEAARALDARGDARRGASGGGMPPALFVVSGGLAVVSGALGLWAGVTTLSLNDDYEAYATSPGATQERAKALFDDASSRQLLANVFLVGAAVFGVAAGVLLFLTDWGGGPDEAPRTARPSTTPTLSVDAHGAVAGLSQRF